MPKKTADGKYLDFEEGALSYVPPPKRIGPFNKQTRKRCSNYRYFARNIRQATKDEAPGLTEFRSRIARETARNIPVERIGRPGGVPDGMTKEEMEQKLKDLDVLLGLREGEIEEVVEFINSEPNPLKRISMRRYMKMVLMTSSDRDVTKALDKILEYNAARPVTKIETKVSDADSAWEEDMGLGDFIPGKDTCKGKSN